MYKDDIDNKTMMALPALTEAWHTQTLQDYFNKKTNALKYIKHKSPENNIFINIITDEIKRLYGTDIATTAKQQLNNFPVIETGSHLGVMKDYDNQHKDNTRASLHQNIIISAALLKSAGGKVHIGSYGSNVSLNHSFSGGYFQIGDELFPTTTMKNVNSSVLYDAQSISQDFFNPQVLSYAKIAGLKEVLTTHANDQEDFACLDIATKAMANIDKSKQGYELLKRILKDMNPHKRAILNKSFYKFNDIQKQTTGVGFDDMEHQYNRLNSAFSNKDLSLSDQIATIQSQEINDITKHGDIEHVSIDCTKVSKDFYIQALKDKNSLWYQIFNNKDLSQKFHQTFADIRTSWKQDESPFDMVAKNKGFTKIKSMHKKAFDHNPEAIINHLEQNEIVPSTALIILAHQSADIMAHGGFFQSTYAKKIQDKFVDFLEENNFNNYANNVKTISADMMILSLAVATNNNKPTAFSKIAMASASRKRGIMKEIPFYPSKSAVANALPTVTTYLQKTSPGYIEQEAQNNSFEYERSAERTYIGFVAQQYAQGRR